VVLWTVVGVVSLGGGQQPDADRCPPRPPPDRKSVVSDEHGRYPVDEVVVQLDKRDFVVRSEALAKRYRARIVCSLPALRLITLKVPIRKPEELDRMIQRLRREPGVEAALRNYLPDLQ
jgi:hypothetical protein